jgi:outer membrane protein assembly factor BamD (BamD/ComL family)
MLRKAILFSLSLVFPLFFLPEAECLADAKPKMKGAIESARDNALTLNNVTTLKQYAIVLIQIGDIAKAETIITRMRSEFSVDTNFPKTLLPIVGAYRQAKEFDQARDLYQRIVTEFPDSDSTSRARRYIAEIDIISKNKSGHV